MHPTIEQVIETLKTRSRSMDIDLYNPATTEEIRFFEHIMKIKLPDDFKEFYRHFNGFMAHENTFRIIPLGDIIDNDHESYTLHPTDFFFADYLLYCDMWSVNISEHDHNTYSLYNKGVDTIILTNSLAEFLSRFIKGDVFNGLYDWHDEIQRKSEK